jgi:hypothetical protein
MTQNTSVISLAHPQLFRRLPARFGNSLGVKLMEKSRILKPNQFVDLIREGHCRVDWQGNSYLVAIRFAVEGLNCYYGSVELYDSEINRARVAKFDYCMLNQRHSVYSCARAFQFNGLKNETRAMLSNAMDPLSLAAYDLPENPDFRSFWMSPELVAADDRHQVKQMLLGTACLIGQTYGRKNLIFRTAHEGLAEDAGPSGFRNEVRSWLRGVVPVRGHSLHEIAIGFFPRERPTS